jgi:PPK2 family polyphosphate:nucleotide phosphotransferase
MDLTRKLAVPHGGRFKLSSVKPDSTPGAGSKKAALAEIEEHVTRLFDLQYRLYAEDKRSVLIVLQALDAGGKDGTIRHVARGLNPQGCTVTSFKVPSYEELEHDFLWRIHKAMPARGDIGIFNRSHYEDVLVVRVHELVPKAVWRKRYDEINDFEKHLVESGTTILKFYLHISPEEQLRRFRARLEDPKKNWKINPADFEERKHWKDYRAAYEDALSKCSTPWAPWYVIPADHKWYRNLAVSRILVGTLEAMDPKFPKAKADIAALRKNLE